MHDGGARPRTGTVAIHAHGRRQQTPRTAPSRRLKPCHPVNDDGRFGEDTEAALADGEITGPAHGTVDLPLHVVWSGCCSYEVEQPRSRMGLYCTARAEWQRQDLVDFLNEDLLIEQWPVLRTLTCRPIRHMWEAAFPELAAATTATAA